jgi:hypothetical protein
MIDVAGLIAFFLECFSTIWAVFDRTMVVYWS